MITKSKSRAASASAGTPRFQYVFVLGVSHCGSTLLGMMLNNHPAIRCVGEMAITDQAIAKSRPCSCGQPVEACAFWRPLLPILTAAGHKRRGWYTPEAYRRVRSALGAEVLLDLSKSAALRMTRGILNPWRRAPAGYIFLVRDSRGAVTSKPPKGFVVRDDEGKVIARPTRGNTLAMMLNQHKKWMQRFARHVARLGDRGLTLYYEDLCTEPRKELEKICRWMGLSFEPSMLDPYLNLDEQHFMHSSISKYTRQSRAIVHDTRWKSRIDDDTRSAIESVMRQIPVLQERYLPADP